MTVKIQTRTRQLAAEAHLEKSGLHPLLARLYASRGLQHPPAQRAGELLHFKALKNIDAATQRLTQALQQQEKIVIAADYDCDGATACAVAVLGLRLFGAHVDYVVPNRFTMGYGLTPAVVDLAREKNVQLIITVDNGIASVEGVLHAQQHGIEVLITDHHLPAASLPSAVAIVNPNQAGCAFASKNLAGVGVMFYVLLALRTALRQQGQFTQDTQPALERLLDLVAVGTVADLVKLDANNRLLVNLGLARLRVGAARPGLLALARVAGREIRQLSTADIGFAIGPRLNAAGRMTDMRMGIECLLSDNEEQAFAWACELHRINAERRDLQAELHNIAQEKLALQLPPQQRSLVLYDDSFHSGVVGLLASKLKDQYHLPTIVFAAAKEDFLTGSGRSIPGLHLRDAIDLVTKRAPALIERFGGHAMAAGLTLAREHLNEFRHHFEEVVQVLLGEQRPERELIVDGALELAYFQPAIAQMLEQEIWGQGFEAPLFFDEWQVVRQQLLKEKHLKLIVEKQGQKFEAIAFNHAHEVGGRVALAFRLATHDWNGKIGVQLVVEQIKNL